MVRNIESYLIMIVRLIYKHLAFSSSISSYSSNTVTQSLQSTTSASRSSSLYESSSFESSTSFVSSDENGNNDNDSYDSNLLSLGTQPEFSYFPESSTSSNSVTITPDAESYYSSVVDGTTQTVTSISGSSSDFESNKETSFVSCDEDSYDFDLLHEGTQSKSSNLPELSTGFDSIEITPDTKSDYSSGSVGATISLSSSFVSNYITSSVSITSSEDNDSLNEVTQPAFLTSAESDSAYDYVTITPDTVSYHSSVPGESIQSESSVIRSTSTFESVEFTSDNQNEANQPLSTTMIYGESSLSSDLDSCDSSTIDEFMQPSSSSTLYNPISLTVS